MEFAFLINIITAFFSMVIMIFLQVVHLPMLKHVGPEKFPTYYESYRLKMIILCFPVMSLEIFTSILVLLTRANKGQMTESMQTSFVIYGISFFLLMLMHVATFQVIQPLFKRLVRKFELKTCTEIVRWNLVRSLGWTLRVILIIATVIMAGSNSPR